MAWLSLQAHRFSPDPNLALRQAASVASMTTIGFSMLSAQFLGGPLAALLIGLLLTLMPGRMVLSHHIWPDIWLGLWLSLVCLILVAPGLDPALRSLLGGTLAALAFVTRFDALVLAPLTGLALSPLPISHWVLVLAPTTLVFLVLSLRNARRYQMPWPDNTWMFNLMITAAETEHRSTGPLLVEAVISSVANTWKSQQRHHPGHGLDASRRLLQRPLRVLWGLLTRLWASLGPDSFVLHRLLPPVGSAYPQIPMRSQRKLAFALRLSFPLFTALIVLAVVLGPASGQQVLWPTLALAVGGLLHNRTRYRQAWLPGAALILAPALGEPDFWTRLAEPASLPAWGFSLLLAVLLVRFPVRPDAQEMP